MTSSNFVEYNNIYCSIKNLPCSQHNSSGEFISVKNSFKKEINSPRRLDAIKTTHDLLNVLEKRDYISPYKINNLREVLSRFLKTCPMPNDVFNNNNEPIVHGHNRVINAPPPPPIINNPPNEVLPRYPADPVERVKRIIAEEIGSKWKDFARALEIPEGNIDRLASEHETTPVRVFEILRFHEDTCDSRRKWSVLNDALDNVRRKDLRIKVQLILDNGN